jgi:dihydropteroate synthase
MSKNDFNIMGIVNVTPDSFYDGGQKLSVDRLVSEGADILDIGGESTRPGSDPVSKEEELRRILPVIKECKQKHLVPISVDTYKAEVARGAIEAGASIVNDISGLTFENEREAMAKLISETGVQYVLTHIQGRPKEMQKHPTYNDVVQEVYGYFKEKIGFLKSCGVKQEQIILDPGIGFGKTLEHNITLIQSIGTFKSLEQPILLGASRKSFIGAICGDSGPKDRLAGSLSTAVLAYTKGVTYFRVHDVLETKRALQVASRISEVIHG